MRIKNLNNTAFSLIEILMAAIIFIISIGGIFATLNAVRVPVANKENALTAAVFGKQVLEALRSQVNQQGAANFYVCSAAGQNPCQDFALSVGQHQVSATTLSNYGLTWPSALQSANTVCGSPATLCLVYNVTCADSVPTDCTTNTTDIAHKVDLKICLDSTC